MNFCSYKLIFLNFIKLFKYSKLFIHYEYKYLNIVKFTTFILTCKIKMSVFERAGNRASEEDDENVENLNYERNFRFFIDPSREQKIRYTAKI